ncbi:unnamed protein product [Paramecium sonneborni]|uniref:NB-ARC domain-containing protein n=1 Tax=Paramecium sonneborni TaxID=65129 RepID=A0A8S1R7H9_9CILI|nr:unnamed protein product [Paramecium sonneborni]
MTPTILRGGGVPIGKQIWDLNLDKIRNPTEENFTNTLQWLSYQNKKIQKKLEMIVQQENKENLNELEAKGYQEKIINLNKLEKGLSSILMSIKEFAPTSLLKVIQLLNFCIDLSIGIIKYTIRCNYVLEIDKQLLLNYIQDLETNDCFKLNLGSGFFIQLFILKTAISLTPTNEEDLRNLIELFPTEFPKYQYQYIKKEDKEQAKNQLNEIIDKVCESIVLCDNFQTNHENCDYQIRNMFKQFYLFEKLKSFIEMEISKLDTVKITQLCLQIEELSKFINYSKNQISHYFWMNLISKLLYGQLSILVKIEKKEKQINCFCGYQSETNLKILEQGEIQKQLLWRFKSQIYKISFQSPLIFESDFKLQIAENYNSQNSTLNFLKYALSTENILKYLINLQTETNILELKRIQLIKDIKQLLKDSTIIKYNQEYRKLQIQKVKDMNKDIKFIQVQFQFIVLECFNILQEFGSFFKLITIYEQAFNLSEHKIILNQIIKQQDKQNFLDLKVDILNEAKNINLEIHGYIEFLKRISFVKNRKLELEELDQLKKELENLKKQNLKYLMINLIEQAKQLEENLVKFKKTCFQSIQNQYKPNKNFNFCNFYQNNSFTIKEFLKIIIYLKETSGKLVFQETIKILIQVINQKDLHQKQQKQIFENIICETEKGIKLLSQYQKFYESIESFNQEQIKIIILLEIERIKKIKMKVDQITNNQEEINQINNNIESLIQHQQLIQLEKLEKDQNVSIIKCSTVKQLQFLKNIQQQLKTLKFEFETENKVIDEIRNISQVKISQIPQTINFDEGLFCYFFQQLINWRAISGLIYSFKLQMTITKRDQKKIDYESFDQDDSDLYDYKSNSCWILQNYNCFFQFKEGLIYELINIISLCSVQDIKIMAFCKILDIWKYETKSNELSLFQHEKLMELCFNYINKQQSSIQKFFNDKELEVTNINTLIEFLVQYSINENLINAMNHMKQQYYKTKNQVGSQQLNFQNELNKFKVQILNQQNFLIFIPILCKEINKFDESVFTPLFSNETCIFENKIQGFLSKTNQNQMLFIYGQAGSGKSYILRKIEEIIWNQEGCCQFPIFVPSSNENKSSTLFIDNILQALPYSFTSSQVQQFKQAVYTNQNDIILIIDNTNYLVDYDFIRKIQNDWKNVKFIYSIKSAPICIKTLKKINTISKLIQINQFQLLPFGEIQVKEYISQQLFNQFLMKQKKQSNNINNSAFFNDLEDLKLKFRKNDIMRLIDFFNINLLQITPFYLKILLDGFSKFENLNSSIKIFKRNFLERYSEIQQRKKLIENYRQIDDNYWKTEKFQDQKIYNAIKIESQRKWESLDFQKLKNLIFFESLTNDKIIQDNPHTLIYFQNLKLIDIYQLFVDFCLEEHYTEDNLIQKKQLKKILRNITLEMYKNEINQSIPISQLRNYSDIQKDKLLKIQFLQCIEGQAIQFINSQISDYFVITYILKFFQKAPQFQFYVLNGVISQLNQDQMSYTYEKLKEKLQNSRLVDEKDLQFINYAHSEKLNKINFSTLQFEGILKFLHYQIRYWLPELENQLITIIRLSSLCNEFVQVSSNCLFFYCKIFGALQNIDLSKINISNIKMIGLSFYKVNLFGSLFSNVDISSCAFNQSNLELSKWNNINFIQQFEIETSEFTCIGISPDGLQFSSGQKDGNIILWDIKGGLQIGKLQGHLNEVESVAYSSDALKLVSGGSDSLLILWDIDLQKELFKRNEHKCKILAVVFSQDNNLIASSDISSLIVIVNINQKNVLLQFKLNIMLTKQIYFFDRDQYLIFGSITRIIKLWKIDLQNGKDFALKNNHKDLINCIAISSDQKFIASGSKDNTIIIWSILKIEEINQLKGHTKQINDIKFKHQNTQLISCSSDQTIRIWNLQNNQEIVRLQSHSSEVKQILLTSNEQILISYSSDSSIKLWDIGCHCVHSKFINYPDQTVNLLKFSSNEEYLAIALYNDIEIWSVINFIKINQLLGHSQKLTAIIFSNNDNQIISSSLDKTIRVWSIDTGEQLYLFYDGYGINSLIYFSNLKKFVYISQDELVTFDDSYEQKREQLKHLDNFSPFILSQNMQLLLFKNDLKQLMLIDIQRNFQTRYLDLQNNYSIDMCNSFSKDMKYIVFPIQDKNICILNLEVLEYKIVEGHTDKIISLEFCNSKTFVSADFNKTIIFWNIQNIHNIRIIYQKDDLESPINCLAFSVKKSILTASNLSNQIIFYKVGTDIATLSQEQSINNLSFSNDGQMIAAAVGKKCELKMWNFETKEEIKMNIFDVEHIIFTPDNRKLILVKKLTNTHQIISLDLETKSQKEITKTNFFIKSIDISSNGQTLAISSDHKFINLFYLDENKLEILKCNQKIEKTEIIKFHNISDQLIIIDDNKMITQSISNENYCQSRKLSSRITSITIAHDGQKIAISNIDNEIHFWLFEIYKEKATLTSQKLENKINCLCFTQDGEYLAIGSQDHSIRIWHIAKAIQCQKQQIYDLLKNYGSSQLPIFIQQCEIYRYDDHQKAIFQLIFHPLKNILVSISEDGAIKIRNIHEIQETFKINIRKKQNYPISYSENGEYLAFLNYNDQVIIWNLNQDQLIKILSSKDIQEVLYLKISQNGEQLILYCQSKKFRLWNLLRDEQIKEYHQEIQMCYFDCDFNNNIAYIKEYKEIFIVNWKGNLQTQSPMIQQDVISIQLSKQGKQLVSSSYKEIYIWALEEEMVLHTITIRTENNPNIQRVIFRENNEKQIISLQNGKVKFINKETQQEESGEQTLNEELILNPYNKFNSIKHQIGYYKIISSKQQHLSAEYSIIRNSDFSYSLMSYKKQIKMDHIKISISKTFLILFLSSMDFLFFMQECHYLQQIKKKRAQLPFNKNNALGQIRTWPYYLVFIIELMIRFSHSKSLKHQQLNASNLLLYGMLTPFNIIRCFPKSQDIQCIFYRTL